MTPDPYRPPLSTVDSLPRAKPSRSPWILLCLGLFGAACGAFVIAVTPMSIRGTPRRYATFEPEGFLWGLPENFHIGHGVVGVSVLLIAVSIVLFLKQATTYRS